VENVEFFLVAAIVILGLRAYIVQPFKIPTNSMWPSYYGMTASAVYSESDAPNLWHQAIRLVGLGATNYSVTAPATGEVLFPVYASTYDGTHYSFRPAFAETSGRSLLIFPTRWREYTFSVAGEQATIKVPAEFDNDFQGVLDEAFKGKSANLYDALRLGAATHKPLQTSTLQLQGRATTVYWIPIGKQVQKGGKILSFDVLTGDLLFVERLSYHFVQPQVGSGFVFKTENIDSPEMKDQTGNQIRQYYVKRLVGTPGDILEIKEPALWRNGQPITGSTAFAKNAIREGKYPGYNNTGNLSAMSTVTVPADTYYALGDNSPRSKDSRYWGFIPEKGVVGRPLFIYYPFTTRWGLAN
jgi:signal peptidase I